MRPVLSLAPALQRARAFFYLAGESMDAGNNMKVRAYVAQTATTTMTKHKNNTPLPVPHTGARGSQGGC
jgi:hypothetical protein